MLLRRSFGLDVLACPTCNGRMNLIAAIENPATAHRILSHLGLPPHAPPRGPPWRPTPPRLVALPHGPDDFDAIDAPAPSE